MKKLFLLTAVIGFMASNLFAGCMKSEIKQIDAKLKSSNISEEKRAEITKLRELVVSNEHSNSEVAFESYEKAMSLFN